ncbi:MAG TPA: hypothetical protein VFQ44_15550 [Streptosporangiaceae bacterium]|nr:hypothetical protein [Streptosporangiaceae bacterium]
MVCDECYRRHADSQQAKAPSPAKTHQPRAQTAQRQPRAAQARQPKKKPQLSASERKSRQLELAARVDHERRQKLERQLPGVSRLFEFFHDAGIDAEAARYKSVRVNGKLTPPLDRVVPSPLIVGWDRFVDHLVLKCAASIFIEAMAANARFGDGLRAFLRPDEDGFAVMRDDVNI